MSSGVAYDYVRCPYYLREDRKQRQIKCEGVTQDTDLYQRFKSTDALERHKETFCKGDYRKCPLACTLDKEYGFE